MEADRVHVLIVDDDSGARAIAREALIKHMPMAKPVEVSNPHEALQRLDKQRFDFIITDYELPTPGGTFMDEIGRLPENKKPFGVLVGFGRVNEIPKVGKVSFLPKPFSPDALISAVKEAADRKAAALNLAGATPAPVAAPSTVTVVETAPPPPPKKATAAPVDVNFINPFMEGVVVVLETVCSTKSTRESVFMQKDDTIRGDISALISMNSSKKQGSFAISFDKKAFLALASRMLGENYTEINEENKDVAGEICNQVFGFAKRKLNNELGYDIQPAIPSVIVGDGHQIRHNVKGAILAAKFKTPEGWFLVEAAVNG